ncbi:helix-turn-helix transcriptional regulator [Streptomyces sp. A-14]|uniref:helix-turn-helix transcriptional regulator n=1 Tax=Streptomyces sp. A-14 TaxID=3127467 RepID=UPI003EBC474A
MPNTPKDPPKGWLWSAGAADYMGVHVVTLYRWRRDEIGPKAKQIGRRRYAYKISELDAWMNSDYVDSDRATAAA